MPWPWSMVQERAEKLRPEVNPSSLPRGWRSVLAILIFGCASTLPGIAVTPVRGPGDVIDRIAAHTDSLQTARIRARISIEIDGVRQRASSVVFFDHPTDLRMDVSGALGVSIMSARFWVDSLRIYLPAENGYLDGLAAPVLYQVTGMNLGYYEVQKAILGIPTLDASDRDDVISFRTTPDHHILDIQSGPYRKHLWIDRRNVTLVREDIVNHDGRLLSRLSLNRYKLRSGCLLPTQIEISQGPNQIAWTVESARVNEGLDPKVFNLTLPDGTGRLEGT